MTEQGARRTAGQRTCDPWAVRSARSLAEKEDLLNDSQKRILEVLRETGGI
jgi:hypothetical protein